VTLPNFLHIGAAKSGSTSIHHYLQQHPQIFICPIKETNFFRFDMNAPVEKTLLGRHYADLYRIKTLADYEALFEGVKHEIAVGEIGIYLGSATACQNIRALLPQAKLIVCLRDPVDKAISTYMMHSRDGFVKKKPAKAFGPDDFYVQEGFYFEKLKRYFGNFPQEQLNVYLYDEFVSKPLTVVQRLFDFLEVDDKFRPDMSVRYNVASYPRYPWLATVLARVRMWSKRQPFRSERVEALTNRLHRKLLDDPPVVPEEVRLWLRRHYREDILQVQDLIAQDLSAWLDES
jgi:hypothetical protein